MKAMTMMMDMGRAIAYMIMTMMMMIHMEGAITILTTMRVIAMTREMDTKTMMNVGRVIALIFTAKEAGMSGLVYRRNCHKLMTWR